MNTCNNPEFSSVSTFSTLFHNTGELIHYQQINPINDSLVDDVVLIKRNNTYYKAIYVENTINIEWYRFRYPRDAQYGDKDMITKAINTAGFLGATLRFDAKKYILNEQLSFANLSCFKISGNQHHTWIISNKEQRFNSYFFKFENCNNFNISDINIDQNKRNLQIYTENDYNGTSDDYLRDFNGGIYLINCSNFVIEQCHFSDLYTRALNIYQCTGTIKICDNVFESELQSQIYRMEHLSITQSHFADFIIQNNIFKNAENVNPSQMACAIFAFDCGNDGSVKLIGNNFNYCGRDNTGHHRLYAVDFYDNVNNFIISGNYFRNCTWGAIRFDGTKKNGIISDNYIHQLISNDSGIIGASSKETTFFENIFKNISISNNIIESSDSQSYGIVLQSQYYNVVSENINIQNNIFDKLKMAVVIIGNINVLNISNNTITNNRAIAIHFITEFTKTNLNIDTSIITNGNAIISNNVIKSQTAGDGQIGIQIDGADDYFKNISKRFLISNNLVYGNGVGYGIIVNTGDSLDGKINISGNEVNNVNYGLYIRCHKTVAKDNMIFNCNIQPILEDYNDNIKFDNFYNNLPI